MKDKVFTLKLSSEERDKMRKLAKDLGMKPSELMRGFINGEIVTVVDDTRLERVVRKVLREG